MERALEPEPAARATVAGPVERRVSIGSDYGGYGLKEVLEAFVGDELGWQGHDCGTHSTDAVDYPDYAAAVARDRRRTQHRYVRCRGGRSG